MAIGIVGSPDARINQSSGLDVSTGFANNNYQNFSTPMVSSNPLLPKQPDFTGFQTNDVTPVANTITESVSIPGGASSKPISSGSSNQPIPDVPFQPVEIATQEEILNSYGRDPDTLYSGTSAQSHGSNDVSANQTSASQPSMNDMFYELFKETGDVAYLEKYIDNMIARENISSARAWEKEMSDTGFSRLAQDIKNAGYNPWLALQNGMSSAASYSTSAASTSGVSQSQQNTSKNNTDTKATNNIITTIISTLGNLAGAIIRSWSSD